VASLWRQVMHASYLSQSELPSPSVSAMPRKPDEVEIVWPGGGKQKLEQVKVESNHDCHENH